MNCTVFGCHGFIGSRLLGYLNGQGHEVFGFGRGERPPLQRDLGHVFFAVGMTGDFRKEPAKTIDAHVTLLSEMLATIRFQSFTYFSSTRVYQNSLHGHELSALRVNPNEPGDLYNLSKLTGEALCLAQAHPGVRVVRISNVIDPEFTTPTFLTMVVREAVQTGAVTINTSCESSKDYLSLRMLLPMLERVALSGRDRLYNLASGQTVSNRLIARLLSEVLGCGVVFAEGAAKVDFPEIENGRYVSEFGVEEICIETELRAALQNLKLAINE